MTARTRVLLDTLQRLSGPECLAIELRVMPGEGVTEKRVSVCSRGWLQAPWPELTYVVRGTNVTYMEKIQIYLPKEELNALRKAAARSGRSVAELVREAIRKVVLKPPAAGPVAIWDGEPQRSSIEHDTVHDEP